MVFAIVEDDGGIFDAFDVSAIVLWADQWTAGAPLEGVLYVGCPLSRSSDTER
jgi:hypothetical protein